MTALNHSVPATSSSLRPLDFSRDLAAVADLVESCFDQTLDPDGREYLQKMRHAARGGRYLHWASQAGVDMLGPLSGFVWEENGKIVANLSLIPFPSWRSRTTLIANVAVHPDYRRRGIARALTNAALEYLHQHDAGSIWLHVRDDNPAAYDLYRTLGFEERFRRTTWHNNTYDKAGSPPEALPNVTITSRHPRHWQQQERWFARTYPADLIWYFPINPHTLRPGMIGMLYRIFNDTPLRQWSAQVDGQLAGVLTWQPSHGYSDYLWLCADLQKEETAILTLLAFITAHSAHRRTLSLDYPFGQAQETFMKAGFNIHHTLIWMQAKN